MAEISGQRFGVVRFSEQQFLPFARIGPTTPKRATTSLAVSVDPTDARPWNDQAHLPGRPD
jgi:hypothetical protein